MRDSFACAARRFNRVSPSETAQHCRCAVSGAAALVEGFFDAGDRASTRSGAAGQVEGFFDAGGRASTRSGAAGQVEELARDATPSIVTGAAGQVEE
ncbi:MAG: hypothetical protein WAS73_00045, partial [Defluviicoccus sp.]